MPSHPSAAGLRVLGALLAVPLSLAGCARGIRPSALGARVGYVDRVGPCHPVGEVTSGLPPAALRREHPNTVISFLRDEASRRGATHILVERGLREVARAGRAVALRCDDEERLEQSLLARRREAVLDARPELRGLDRRALQRRADDLDPQHVGSGLLVGVGVMGMIAGVVVIGVSAGTPGRSSCSSFCFGGSTWTPGRPADDGGLAIGGVVTGAGALALITGVVWLVSVMQQKKPLLRLLELDDGLSLEADIRGDGGLVRLEVSF